MQRRTVLLGFGAAAAGSGIVFGSGAFTQVEAERELTIGIDEDSEALLGLVANDDVASVFEDDETGELVIDTEALSDGDEGFNVGSTVQIGQTDETFGDEVDDEDYAFKVVNNFDEDDDGNFDGELDIGVGLPGLEPSESDATLELVATRSGEEEGQTVVGGETKVFEDVESGEEIYVAIRITTDSTSDPEDLEGEVVFQAGANLTAEDFPEEESLVGEGEVRNLDTGDTYDGADAISDAVGEANEGNRLLVGLGTYEESVTIDVEGLTLEAAEGANPTIDAGGASGTAVGIDASDVRVEGFTVQDFAQNGMTIFPSANGAEVVDNTVDTSSVSQGTSFAINTDDGGAENLLIKNNELGYGQDGSLQLNQNSEVTVEGNTISSAQGGGSEIGIAVGSGSKITITDNTISDANNGIQAGSGVIGGVTASLDNLDINSNDITGNGDGVVIAELGSPVTSVSINQNNLQSNSDNGVRTEGGVSETVDATNNWWGDASGPSGGVEDPETGVVADGDGAEISSDNDIVRFDPFAEEEFDLEEE